MKIVCSAGSCKYSSEVEDSSNIIFISFPNNDTAAIWAHNCGRTDLIAKSIQDLHANHYICSNHIEDQFFISKKYPIIIAEGAVPTIFQTPKLTDVCDLEAADKYRSQNVIDSLQLSEFISVVNDCHSQVLVEDACRPLFQQPVNKKQYAADSDTNTYDTVANVNQSQRKIPSAIRNICRMCGLSIADGIEIFGDKGLKMGLNEKIILHTPITLDSEDIMPHKVCSSCCEKLEATHLLVVTCLQTDMRLRRILNSNAKVEYNAKYEELVKMCSTAKAEKINLHNSNVIEEISNNCNKVDKTTSCSNIEEKCQDIPSNVEFEHVQISPNENSSSTSKFIVQWDLKNLFQSLKSTSVKNNERSNKPSLMEMQPILNESNSRFNCSGCNVLFESKKTLSMHETACSSYKEQTIGKNIAQLDSKVICLICRLQFDDLDSFTSHQKSCDESWTPFGCRYCDALFNNKDNLDCHELSHTKRITFIAPNRRCGHCSAVFNTRKELQGHITNSHNNQPLFKCGICEKTYGKWSSLDVHEATHRLDKPYLCDLCGKSFKHSNNLRGHKRIHLEESKKKRHVCDICGSAFRSRFHLREHANQHNGSKPYKCEECGKTFCKRIQLRQHRLSHGSNKFICPLCGMSFNRRGNMNTHLKRHNKNEGTYTCSVCESQFKSMRELKTHRKQHSESDILESIKLKAPGKTVWQCKICDKVFSKQAPLLNHERMHTGDRVRVECRICGKKLANKKSLKYHEKSIHSTERPHLCQFCDEAFVSKEAKLIHERIHTGERPYTCKICSMQYRCSSNLSQHMKIHSSIRPYVCRYCDKTFTRKGALHVHERIHTRNKPYVCTTCDRSFSQKINMLKHIESHEPKPTQCNKCDKVFDSKSEILTHFHLHEQSSIDNFITPQYAEATLPLESYSLDIQCSSNEKVDELQIVQSE